MTSRFELVRMLAGRGRMEILDHLRRRTGPPPTINEIARVTGVPLATAWAGVHDLENLGLVLIDWVAKTAMVRLNVHTPAWPRVEALLALDLRSPQRLAFDHFVRRLKTRLPDVSVHLFGSLQAGNHRPESDVDVEVVYGETGLDRDGVEKVCAQVSNETLDLLRISVMPIVSRRRTVSLHA